jgi:hypothetical protein
MVIGGLGVLEVLVGEILDAVVPTLVGVWVMMVVRVHHWAQFDRARLYHAHSHPAFLFSSFAFCYALHFLFVLVRMMLV